MEPELLQLIVVFTIGLVSGALIMLLWNKLSSGSASPAGLKQEYKEYQEKVETHFEETSKKFQDMTEQYQDLYKHLSVGAASLCRPDSVAAALADESQPQVSLEKPSESASLSDVDMVVPQTNNADSENVENIEDVVSAEPDSSSTQALSPEK